MRDFSNINTFYAITKKVDFFPPWKKCVKKENLFDPPAGGELFSFSEKNRFLAIFSAAAAFPPVRNSTFGRVLLTFFGCSKKVSARPAKGQAYIKFTT